MTDRTPDRYVTFLGIDCTGNADRLMAILTTHLQQSPSPWVRYFQQKLIEKDRMARDNLHFIGSQVNALAAFLEETGDEEAMALLWHLEQKCC